MPASLSAAPCGCLGVLVTINEGRDTPGEAESSHTLTSHPSHTTFESMQVNLKGAQGSGGG